MDEIEGQFVEFIVANGKTIGMNSTELIKKTEYKEEYNNGRE